jgi:type I restriction enzyme S subunit
MSNDWFFEKFALIADAPGAIERMRGLVLDLAVRGHLLTSTSRWEKHLLKSRTTKIGSGATPAGGRESYSTEGTPLIRSMNIHFRGFNETGLVFLSDEQADKLSNVAVQPNDVLLNITGASIGRVTIAPDRMDGARVNQHVTVIRTKPDLSPRFLAMFLASPNVQRMINEIQTGATRQALTKGMIEQFEIPLPPLAEQKRIVAKVDELMGLCDALESQQQERELRQSVLVRSSLSRFAEAPTPENLGYLFHTSYDIPPSELRKSILTLAVQGKLVPQNPNDEPAKSILMKIENEKKRLCDTGGMKADKKVWINSSTTPPHKIPDSWLWVRLQDVFEISRGGSPRPAGDPRYFGGSCPWITVGELTNNSCKYLTETATGLTKEGSERSRFINPGDLLLTNSGATLGVPKISKIRGCINDGVAVLRLFHLFNLNDFGFLYLTQQTQAFRSVNQGMGQPNLNTSIIAGWFFPVPPLAEQHRIVAKVDQLMALVDELERQQEASREKATKLLDAIVHEMTSGGQGIAATLES